MHKSKEGTSRIAMWRLGIKNSYTMEATFGGSTLGQYRLFKCVVMFSSLLMRIHHLLNVRRQERDAFLYSRPEVPWLLLLRHPARLL